MKFLVALVAILATFECIKAWDLICGLNRFEFRGSPSEFPGWRGEQIKVGTCALGSKTYGLEATYEDCGMSVQADGDVLNIHTNLLSEPIREIITRKRPVEQKIGCTFNTKTLTSAATAVQPIVGQIGGLVTKTGKAIQFTLKYRNPTGDNKVTDGQPLQIPVGKEVEVEVSGPDLETFDVYAAISDCFATPSADQNDATMYTLVSRMCIEDDSVTITREGRNQIMKFKSFAFTSQSTEMVYLHCDVFACTSLKRCGKCVKDWRTISRAWIKAWNERIRIPMVFEPNTIQTLNISNLRCQPNGFRFRAAQGDFPLWKPNDIMIGSCPLKEDFSLEVTYAQCGLFVKERRHQLLMQTFITGKPSSDVIQRKRPINYMLRCGYDRFASVSSEAISPILPDASFGHTYTNQPDMFLNILDKQGLVTERATIEVDLRETVVAVIGGKNVGSLRMRLYAVNCFVTPTADASGAISHDLLKDGCPVDETYRSETFGAGQKIYFDAFMFTQVKDAQMYLHCDVTACLDNQNCGECNTQNRRKRTPYWRYVQRFNAQYSLKPCGNGLNGYRC